MATQPEHRYTPEEYLELERAADFKSEYLNGRILAMGGASAQHVLIVTNVVRELSSQLRTRPCTVYSTDLRVRVSREGLYAYPDVVVVCGEPMFADEQFDVLENPLLIVEVLSPSTKDYDRGEKFEQYRRIPTFTAYVLIAQDRPHVELFVKQSDGGWLLTETGDLGAVIELVAIDCRLALAEVYAKVPLGGA